MNKSSSGIKDHSLFKVGIWLGVFPSIIFFAITAFWFVLKFYFILDYKEYFFFSFGFFFLSIFLSIAGIILLVFYLISEFKTYHFKTLFSLIVMSLSFPIMVIIGRTQSNYEEYISLKITNKTTSHIDSMQIIGYSQIHSLDEVKINKSSRYSFLPDYSVCDDRSYQIPRKLKLVIFHNNKIDTTFFPNYHIGGSVHLSIINSFQIDTANDKYVQF